MGRIAYETGAYYVFDRGYDDFSMLCSTTVLPAYFVVRAKRDLSFRKGLPHKADRSTGVGCDQIGLFTGHCREGPQDRVLRQGDRQGIRVPYR